jgi:hypothetical protein
VHDLARARSARAVSTSFRVSGEARVQAWQRTLPVMAYVSFIEVHSQTVESILYESRLLQRPRSGPSAVAAARQDSDLENLPCAQPGEGVGRGELPLTTVSSVIYHVI